MLNEILASRRQELVREQAIYSLEDLQLLCSKKPPTRSLSTALSGPSLSLIAEIKGSSPSRGRIRSMVDPVEIGQIFEDAGVAAISILTEPNYFSGSLAHLRRVRNAVNVPVLRKDFIFDDYQIYQSRVYDADAVLLMAAVLSDDRNLEKLINLAHELGLEVLVESANEQELKRTLNTGADVLGINNRDFNTLKLDLNISFSLIKDIDIKSDRPIISESGIFTRDDVLKLEKAGFNGILVGTALMESENIGMKIKELMGIV